MIVKRQRKETPTNTPFISPNSQSLRTELHFQFIRFAAAILQCASVCFHTEHRISAFWKVRFKKRSKIEQKDIITPMHCLAFPSALFGAPFHIDNRTVADCGFWLEYASKTPLEVVADIPHRMSLFWLRCQIMRLRSVHIKPHYSQNAFDSALLAWYERGIYHKYPTPHPTHFKAISVHMWGIILKPRSIYPCFYYNSDEGKERVKTRVLWVKTTVPCNNHGMETGNAWWVREKKSSSLHWKSSNTTQQNKI